MNFNNLLDGISRSGLAPGLAGGLAGGALTGAMMSKSGRKAAATALKLGGVAAIGGLAWKAWHSYQAGQAAGAPHAVANDAGQALADPAVTEGSRGLLLIRAMIAAASADGHVDAGERQRIFARVEALDLSGAEKGLLFDELANPASTERIAAGVNDMETAVEVYAASLLAIDETRPEGRVYLDALAHRLSLPAPLVQEIHRQRVAHDEAA